MANPHAIVNHRALAKYLHPMMLPLLRQWLPGGTLQGNEYVALNPTRNDNRLGSFKCNIRTGRWCDFSTGDAGGDLISLYAYLQRTTHHKAALHLIESLSISGRDVE